MATKKKKKIEPNKQRAITRKVRESLTDFSEKAMSEKVGSKIQKTYSIGKYLEMIVESIDEPKVPVPRFPEKTEHDPRCWTRICIRFDKERTILSKVLYCNEYFISRFAPFVGASLHELWWLSQLTSENVYDEINRNPYALRMGGSLTMHTYESAKKLYPDLPYGIYIGLWRSTPRYKNRAPAIASWDIPWFASKDQSVLGLMARIDGIFGLTGAIIVMAFFETPQSYTRRVYSIHKWPRDSEIDYDDDDDAEELVE